MLGNAPVVGLQGHDATAAATFLPRSRDLERNALPGSTARQAPRSTTTTWRRRRLQLSNIVSRAQRASLVGDAGGTELGCRWGGESCKCTNSDARWPGTADELAQKQDDVVAIYLRLYLSTPFASAPMAKLFALGWATGSTRSICSLAAFNLKLPSASSFMVVVAIEPGALPSVYFHISNASW